MNRAFKPIKSITFITSLCSILLVVSALANDNQAFAKSILSQKVGVVESFSIQNEVPNYSANPKEINLEDSAINDQAQIEAKQNIASIAVADSYKNRDRKYDKFIEETWAKNSLDISKDPHKQLEKNKIECERSKKGRAIDDLSIKLRTKKNMKISTISDIETGICEEPGEKLFDCDRKLHLTCKQSDECDNGGIIKSSVVSDMKFEYAYPNLVIGTIADNYWGGWCQTYDRVTKFQVRNKDKIKEFRIAEVGFDDYLWIKVNGHTVYVGPKGGHKIEVVHNRVDNGEGRHGCELSTNWHIGVNIDLLPYLRDGENDIFMRVIVAGNGEGWMKIIAKQHCCKEWVETWENKCESELNEIANKK